MANVMFFGKAAGSSRGSSRGGAVDSRGRLTVGSAVREALVGGAVGRAATKIAAADRSVTVVVVGDVLALARGSVGGSDPVALTNGSFVTLPPQVREKVGGACRLAPCDLPSVDGAEILGAWRLPKGGK